MGGGIEANSVGNGVDVLRGRTADFVLLIGTEQLTSYPSRGTETILEENSCEIDPQHHVEQTLSFTRRAFLICLRKLFCGICLVFLKLGLTTNRDIPGNASQNPFRRCTQRRLPFCGLMLYKRCHLALWFFEVTLKMTAPTSNRIEH